MGRSWVDLKSLHYPGELQFLCWTGRSCPVWVYRYFWTNKIQNCLHVLQCNYRFRSLVSFWAATPLQSLPLSPLFIRHNASTPKPMAFALFHTLAPTSGTISPKTSGTLLLSLPSKANWRHFSSQNISAKQRCPSPLSVCTVCVLCVCVHVCVHLLHSYTWTHVNIMCWLSIIFICTFLFADNISMSMYIMCVILWLFSALSCMVALYKFPLLLLWQTAAILELKEEPRRKWKLSSACFGGSITSISNNTTKVFVSSLSSCSGLSNVLVHSQPVVSREP